MSEMERKKPLRQHRDSDSIGFLSAKSNRTRRYAEESSSGYGNGGGGNSYGNTANVVSGPCDCELLCFEVFIYTFWDRSFIQKINKHSRLFK
jgi:hypothetical protein